MRGAHYTDARQAVKRGGLGRLRLNLHGGWRFQVACGGNGWRGRGENGKRTGLAV
ncbi:hypothetical protein [Eikenella sp. Marseille-P7795]|uniref:hypothetical protein n=1 Tax=Eikenella sp. Marseille-P7795 TaxID=2866577 RepID=UPI001CE40457|nr:hypothetical protein [Eikenella sp. Marseille-P7795]